MPGILSRDQILGELHSVFALIRDECAAFGRTKKGKLKDRVMLIIRSLDDAIGSSNPGRLLEALASVGRHGRPFFATVDRHLRSDRYDSRRILVLETSSQSKITSSPITTLLRSIRVTSATNTQHEILAT